MDSINGVLHIIIVTVSNVFRRNFRSCHQKKMPSSRHFNCSGKFKKKSNFIFIFGQMIEDQVLFHLPKFGKNIFSLRNFPDRLKWRDEAVPQGSGFGSLKSVSTPSGRMHSILSLTLNNHFFLLPGYRRHCRPAPHRTARSLGSETGSRPRS